MIEILPKLDLNITNRCNFRCTHCAFNSGICNMQEMSLSSIEKILIETKKLGGKRFDITGGEPTLRGDVEEIVKIGKKLDYNIELVTNGSLLTRERLIGLKQIGLDSIAISLDGSNFENYSRIRKVDRSTYEKVLENINGSIEIGLPTKINTVAFESNISDINNIIDWSIKVGAKELGLYYFTPIGRGKVSSEEAIEPVKWLEFIRNDLKKYHDSKIKISLELPLIEKKYWSPTLGCIGCGQRKGHLQILPDGNVYPCAILASYSTPLANLYEIEVESLWTNKGLWKEYWGDISTRWKSQGGFCVDFKGSFKGKDYDSSKYGFVCPLRKFNLRDVP